MAQSAKVITSEVFTGLGLALQIVNAVVKENPGNSISQHITEAESFVERILNIGKALEVQVENVLGASGASSLVNTVSATAPVPVPAPGVLGVTGGAGPAPTPSVASILSAAALEPGAPTGGATGATA